MAASRGLLETFWSHLGPSWGVLGASRGDLGASWAALGASWAALGRLLGSSSKNIDFKTAQGGGGMAVFGNPFWLPNRPKTIPKTDQNPRRFSRARKTLFKTVLEPSWADLGPFWAPSWGPKSSFRIGKRSMGAKSAFLTKISFQDAS